MCNKCDVNKFILLGIMKFHILQHGFSPNYIICKYHDENTVHLVVEDIPRSNEMTDVIDDVMVGVLENDTNRDEGTCI